MWTPPAQGGIQILGTAEAAALVVLVTMQLKFRQSFVVIFQVPQLQFIDRVVDTSVASQRQDSQCKLYRRLEIPWCSSGMVVDMSVGVPTTGYGSDGTENCGVPQVQYSDKVVDVPAVQFIDVGRPCVYAVTQSRSWTCHRFSSSRESADIPVATETVTHFAFMAATKVFFWLFWPFFASSGCPGVERQPFWLKGLRAQALVACPLVVNGVELVLSRFCMVSSLS